MRRSGAAVLLLLVALAGCGSGTDESGALATAEEGVVAYVNDGDTLRLRDGRRVRLLQIDAPELHGDCYGKASLSALRRLAPEGARVTLERDPRLDARDGYGRLLRYVLRSGRNLNIALVREGAASPYFYENARGRHAKALLEAVAEARRGQRGYWGACPGAKLSTGVGSVTGPA